MILSASAARPSLPIVAAFALALSLAAAPVAAAQDDSASGGEPGASDARRVLVGFGPRTIPRFPGAADNRISVFPVIEVWNADERQPAESPDESFGFAVIGDRDRVAIGPALTFAPRRRASDVPLVAGLPSGLDKIGFGVEVGGFAETFVLPALRVRAEVRHGIGAHDALTGDVAVDAVARSGDDRVIATIGPRLRWGSAKYNRTYFGADGSGALPVDRPGAGLYAAGVQGGAHWRLTRRFGLYGFAGYDRLIGDAGDGVVVRALGDRDQFSAGVAATWRIGPAG